MRALRLIWPWARTWWKYAAAGMFFSVIAVGINLMVPLLTQRVIDDGIAVDDGSTVARLSLLMLLLIVAGMAAGAASSAIAIRFAHNTVTDLRRDVFGRTQSFSFGNLDQMASGEILTRLTSDISKLTTFLGMTASFLTQLPIMLVGALLAIVAIDASLIVIVLVMLPVIGLSLWIVISRSTFLYDLVQSRIDRLNTVLQEGIHGIEVIKAFVRQDHEQERFDEAADDLAADAIRVNQLVASLFPTLILISSLGIAAVLWMGGGNVIDGALTRGELVAFISYMSLVSMPLMMFSFIQPLMSAAGASMVRIDELLGQEPEIVHDASARDLAEVADPGTVEFRGVTFRYGGADAGADEDRGVALHAVNLRIASGTTVAILGATGSGKSTLVQLIPRFYDATEGTVLVGGVDVRELTRSSLRRNVAIALQQPQLFSGTVMENLRFGRPDATDDEAVAAARAAQAHEFVSAMPEGYQSRIAESGSNLSGGQRQRLAIARTLVTDPRILILDDSTSAVDLETEAHIQKALEAWADRTVIIVAQRISTALGADVIVVMDEGCVVGHGTHAELMERSQIYREILQSQLGEVAT